MSRGRTLTGRALAAGLVAVVTLSACAQGPVARGKIAGIDSIVKRAEANGAMRCAPGELALAKSHSDFAKVRLDQGRYYDAQAHLELAEKNAHAALDLSPGERCGAEGPSLAREGDRDGDGIGDEFDSCPDQRETYNGYEDIDGCPDDPDSDKDGIPDSKDQCPLAAEDKDSYLDEDGCPDLDNDSDTVPDVDDQCPNTPGQPNAAKPGCPALVVVTAKEIRITQQIQFDTGKATIKPVSFPILDAVKDVLVANPKVTIEVQGHTDNVGAAAMNLKLSQDRANSVKAYLVKGGVDESRLVAKGYGMNQPLVPNDNAANKALNRRVQFIRTEGANP
jgi:outer membrane protein OmpA-like peptidoglycan-associated protein